MTGGRRTQNFRATLAAIVAAGVAVRVIHVLAVAPSTGIFTDGYFFHEVARFLAGGHGYVNPAELAFKGHSVATAAHPPLYTFVLAAATKLGITGDEAQRSLGCLLGAGTIAAVGVLGCRVAGAATGLVAALIAAFHPLLIGADGALMSETLYGLLIAFVLIAAYRTLDQPTVRRAVVLGLVVGLCALTRAEALLLVPLLTLPVAWRADRWRRRLALIGAGCLATVVVVAPWTARNWSAFGQPVLISTNDGLTVAGANCAAAYHGRDLGSFRTDCIGPITSPDNEARQADRYRSQGLSYARDHAGRLPMVMVVRVLRVWGLYQPTALTFDAQNRSHAVATAGVGLSYLLIPFAVVGAVLIRRRREPLFVLLAPVLLVTITCALTYGGLRFRHAAEIPLAVLAATAVPPVWKRATRRAEAARRPARRRAAGGRSRRASGRSPQGSARDG